MKARFEFGDKEAWLEYLKIYFAAMAMQGICSNQQFIKNLDSEVKLVAIACLEMANALIEELNKPIKQ